MIYVDADACPVKAEVEKVGTRHGVQMFIVSNGGLRPSQNPLVETVIVSDGPDIADMWIADRAKVGDVVITGDIPLAAKCVEAGAKVLKHNGEALTQANIGNILVFDAVPILEMNDRVDAGENFHDAIDEMITLYPDWTDEFTLWRERWIEMASPAIDPSVRLLRALRRAGHPVFALSNFGIQTLEIAQRDYPFLEEFDRRYISGEMGVIKPDAAIYQRLEDDCGLPPASLLFTDDRAENIAVARARGWQTHLFEPPQGPLFFRRTKALMHR